MLTALTATRVRPTLANKKEELETREIEMEGVSKLVKKGLGEMGFNAGGGIINWFPGHMAAATRAIRDRLKLADLVVEVRDSRIPLSSANEDLQPLLASKRRIIALNKKDLANPNIMHKWTRHFELHDQDAMPINAHSKSSVKKLLDLVELKLREVITREPTLIVMVLGVPNVGKSALINNIHRISSSLFPVQDKVKRATVGPLPGVTQDIAGFKIANRPSIYVLDTPGVLVPSISDIETGLKLALAGCVKDSVVGEERIAQFLLAILNSRGTPLHWKRVYDRKMGSVVVNRNSVGTHQHDLKDLPDRTKPSDNSDFYYIEDVVTEVQSVLYASFSEFNGTMEDEDDMESLIEKQFELLQKALRIPKKASEARLMASKKFLALFRAGKLGPFILDDVPEKS